MRRLVAIVLFLACWLMSVAAGFIAPQILVGEDVAGALWSELLGIVAAVLVGPSLGSVVAYLWLSQTRSAVG